ncbi:MAG: tRNA (adenosine(37)-N6)-threonylcarbamoyltransferase complex ATPase subunit type 1 TsaE [Eubacteriales bacterium]|nr:tRNA (adenosine(37)-N6)-threonylcarbamoyltransferase complex ATPase subunit type 1 TsaE [Eubacteriales bacterium]
MVQTTNNLGGAVYRASLISPSPQATEELARRMTKFLRVGDLILAFGDLGSGKTCFARGLARGLQVEGEVASPSFTYMREYYPEVEAGVALYHFDCYRLRTAEEWYEMGFDDYLDGSGVALIEWPERVLTSLPKAYLRLELRPTDKAEEREISLSLPKEMEPERRDALLALWQNFAAEIRG